MSFLWPGMLASLLIIPVLVVVYVRVTARRSRQQAELGTMGELRAGSGRPVGWRRHVPVLLFGVALVLLVVALARPEATIRLPHREGTVILAFDVSNSMRAKDVKPSRLTAAKQAASQFVEAQPSTIRIGVVAFSDTGIVVQKPTRTKRDILSTIRRLTPGGGTSTGAGILTSLEAIAGKRLTIDPAALENGSTQPKLPFLRASVVVLLSDGENTGRVNPVAAATVAEQAGVRVDPVGLGTSAGAVVTVDGFNVATSLDESSLRQVAQTTNGTYYRAPDAAALRKVYGGIDLKLTIQGQKNEITSLFAAGAVVVLLVAGALSLRWFGRVP
jgi:Ca-activated chloride channel family protein